MGTLNDEILRATGGPTVNDGLRAWFLARGATSGTLEDLERQFLNVVYPPGNDTDTISDLWNGFLTQSGYTLGTVQDRQLQYWSAQP